MDACESDPQWVVPYTPRARSPPGSGTVLCLRSYDSSGSFFANTTPATSTAPMYFENTWSTPLSFAPISTPQSGVSPSGTRKRRHPSTGNDENMPPTPADGNTSKKSKHLVIQGLMHERGAGMRQHNRSEWQQEH
ncbi:hypothetical protein C8R44DRAFT_753663 [Mycena epipterygia]|nr:hypothetical protein C8R44DRAFT_753663 [Mycena epipterygia]